MKNYFKNYLLGYLNEYSSYRLYIDIEEGDSYKDFKVKKVANYLKVPSKYLKIFTFFIPVVSLLEIPLSLLVLTLRFFKSCLIFILTRKTVLKNSNIILGLNCKKKTFLNMLESVEIVKEDVIIVKLPTVSIDYSEFQTVKLLSGVNFLDIIKSYINAVKMVFFIKQKYNKRDFLFRAQASFEYFLCCCFINRIDKTNNHYFYSLIDRWAYLYGSLDVTTYLIQHGIIGDSLKFKKIGKVDYAYYIDREQKNICEKNLIENKPVASFRKKINLTVIDKLYQHNLKNVLIICNMSFFEKEKEIIHDLNKKVNLFIKPHPGDSYDSYNSLLLKYKFILLEKDTFPKVDIVISYISTLATEYELNGIPILRYNDESFKTDYDNNFKNQDLII